MAKKAGRPKKPGGEGSQVRIDRDLATMARAIADRRGVTLGDYLGSLLREDIQRDYAKMLKELNVEISQRKADSN